MRMNGIADAALLVGALGAASLAAAAAPGETFRDCTSCPEMVVIPAGSMEMGSDDAEKSWAVSQGAGMEGLVDESPRHLVRLRSFAMGRYDVTWAEYAEFVRETGHEAGDACHESSMPGAKPLAHASWRHPGHEPSAGDPVVCVSWRDAQAYVAWLNGKVPSGADGGYRLPSEAEWEYAARGGSTTRFWWGESPDDAGDRAWYDANSAGRSHAVGSKRPNSFGLYDMVGNVWQWTQDCYEGSYDHAPADGSPMGGEGDCLRVDRGGSWRYPARLLRSATRERNRADFRDVIMGFRVARTLPAKGGDEGDARYARPGATFRAGATRLNFHCLGTGSPAVVFDAGYSDWSPAWAIVLPAVAKWTRACAYDRAGSGFSGPGPKPRTSSRIADELLAALRDGGVRGPYILVGSAYGGLNVRTFAQRHMRETAGLVLVDGDATGEEPAALQEADHRSQREIVAFFQACRDALAAGKPLEVPARSGGRLLRCDRQFFRGLPEAAWSRELNEQVAELTRSKVALYEALVSEMEEVAGDEAYLREHEKSLGSRPIRVLTSGHHGGGPRDAASPEGLEYQRQVASAQARWLALSTDSKQVFARRSSEYIQLDEPAVVVQAIREVFDAASRSGARK